MSFNVKNPCHHSLEAFTPSENCRAFSENQPKTHRQLRMYACKRCDARKSFRKKRRVGLLTVVVTRPDSEIIQFTGTIRAPAWLPQRVQRPESSRRRVAARDAC